MLGDGQYLGRLQDYYAKHRVLPSYARIGALVGLNSKASVAEMVLRLKGEGFLQSTPDKRRKPGKRFFDRSVPEHVRAGMPCPAADTAAAALAIDAHLAANQSKTLPIQVRDD